MSDASWYHHREAQNHSPEHSRSPFLAGEMTFLPLSGPLDPCQPSSNNWKLISFDTTWKNKHNLSLNLSLLPLLACTYLKNAWDLVLRALVFGFIDLLSVWTIEIKAIIFFPLHHIALNRIVMNRIALHSNRGESYRITSHRKLLHMYLQCIISLVMHRDTYHIGLS